MGHSLGGVFCQLYVEGAGRGRSLIVAACCSRPLGAALHCRQDGCIGTDGSHGLAQVLRHLSEKEAPACRNASELVSLTRYRNSAKLPPTLTLVPWAQMLELDRQLAARWSGCAPCFQDGDLDGLLRITRQAGRVGKCLCTWKFIPEAEAYFHQVVKVGGAREGLHRKEEHRELPAGPHGLGRSCGRNGSSRGFARRLAARLELPTASCSCCNCDIRWAILVLFL